jgi:hypothetical protein
VMQHKKYNYDEAGVLKMSYLFPLIELHSNSEFLPLQTDRKFSSCSHPDTEPCSIISIYSPQRCCQVEKLQKIQVSGAGTQAPSVQFTASKDQ